MGDAATDLYDTIVGRLADLGEREASQADRHSTGTSAAVFLMRACKKLSLYGFQPVAPPPGSAMPSSLYYSKTMTDSDVTATAISFLFWRVLNTENIVRLRC